MTTDLPYAAYDIDWEGDGPANGGSQDSDQWIGENEMVVTQVSIQPKRVFWAGHIPIFIDANALDLYPGANAPTVTVLPQPAIPSVLAGDYTDTTTGFGYGDVSFDGPLSAPPVPTGDTWMRGGN